MDWLRIHDVVDSRERLFALHSEYYVNFPGSFQRWVPAAPAEPLCRA